MNKKFLMFGILFFVSVQLFFIAMGNASAATTWVDISAQVDRTISNPIRSRRLPNAQVNIQLTNNTVDPLAGPLRFVLTGLNPDTVSLGNLDGVTAEGDAYILVAPYMSASLAAGETTTQFTLQILGGGGTTFTFSPRVDQEQNNLPNPDRDGDGVNNDQDLYPDDPTRYRLAAIAGSTVVLQNTFVQIGWSANTDVANLTGYNIYRRPDDAGTAIKINSNLITDVTFLDTAVVNGVAYHYQIVAVDIISNEGEPNTETPIFVAYNTTGIENFTATRNQVPVVLGWTDITGFRYQLYRDQTGGIAQALVVVDAVGYEDASTVWQQNYAYQIASIVDFINPLNNQAISIIGPRSPLLAVPALPNVTLQLDDALQAADGVWQIAAADQQRITITGRYNNALGAVDIVATNTSESISSTASDGIVRLVLPVITGTWTLNITERNFADRQANLSLRLLTEVNLTPPNLVIDGETQRNVNAEFIEITGTVSSSHSTISAITVNSNRYPGQIFGVIIGANNYFSSEIPLQIGDNLLTVVASDAVNNNSSVQITVTKSIGLTPTVVITNPVFASQVSNENIVLSGIVYTALPPEQVKIKFRDLEQFATLGTIASTYAFSFDDVILQAGVNSLTVSVITPAGLAEASSTVTLLIDGTPPVVIAPQIELNSPSLNTVIGEDSVTITGSVSSSGGPVTVEINGQVVEVIGADDNQGQFEQVIDLSSYAAGDVSVNIVVTDSQGNSSTELLTLTRDIIAPAITISTTGIQLAPVVNTVVQSPFPLQGSISDVNLSGASINGQTLALLPAAQNSYVFEVAIELPPGENQLLSIEAWDLAGNRSSRELNLLSNALVNIEIVSPRDGEELRVSGANASIELTARFINLLTDYQVETVVDNGAPQVITINQNVAQQNINLAATDGQHEISVLIRNTNGEVIAKKRSRFSFVNSDNIALGLAKIQPENGQTGVEPNDFIVLNFSKTIDPSLLQIIVRETAFGLIYDLSGQQGADLTTPDQVKLVPVQRDQEIVPGGLALFPGNRMVAFHQSRDFAYGGDVFVDVIYNGNEIKRFTFKIRPLPTFVQGIVSNQLMQAVAGIKIEIPELDRKAVTDSDGSFSFGFGDNAEKALPGGRYTLRFNSAMKNPLYGTLEQWVNIEEGRLTRVGMTQLPLLNPDVPFRRISSGDSQAMLASGGLVLNLANSQLLFPDGRDTGDVHVQFLAFNEIPFPMLRSAMPSWLYAVQPAGIEMTGTVGIDIEMPLLLGTHDYVPTEGTRVLMVGFNNLSKQIMPVGLGRIENNRVLSVTPINLAQLDYFGFALLDASEQALLLDYEQGNLSLAQLIAKLESG